MTATNLVAIWFLEPTGAFTAPRNTAAILLVAGAE